jgi:hypothetical protein
MNRLVLPTVSVVIELDNATLVDFSVRSKKLSDMLFWVYTGESVNIVDIIIVHNQKQKEMVEMFVLDIDSEYRHVVRLLGMDAEHASYYKMKNAGASLSKGELLVFLDSDLTPAIGRFYDLVQPLYEKTTVAVSGYASFPADAFISRAYSLFWMFPIFNQPETMGKYQLVANSCAFKRDWFLQKPFSTDIGGLRTACSLISARLKQEGHVLHHPNVWFYHELWNDSWRFFIWRALVMGRDADKKQGHKVSFNKSLRIKHALKSIYFDMSRLTKRHVKYYNAIGLPLWQVPASYLVGAAFWLVVRASQLISAFRKYNSKQEKIPTEFIA